MEKEDSKILSKIGKESGFKVPENFFEDFNKKLMDNLPEVEITDVDVKPNLWMRVRTYVYMAAMFAGVWCMMNVFNGFNGQASRDKKVAEIASGIKDAGNADEFMMNGNVSDFDIMTYQDSVEAGEEADGAELESVTAE